LNHRDPQFLELIREVKSLLKALEPGQGWVPYLIGGSGTAAMEAMVTSCAPRKQRSLILENGYYSERMAELFEVHGLPHQKLNFGWLAGYDLALVGEMLEGGIGAVFATHHETTTGRLNEINGLTTLCQQAGVPIFVDAMSSFGADSLPQGITGFCSTANKCIHGLPGVSYVMLSSECADRIREFDSLTYYLHLPRYEGDQPPLTPPVPMLQAFRQALREHPGIACQRDSYLEKVKMMEEALLAIGSELLLAPSHRSCALLVASVPFGLTYSEWFETNYHAGFVVYGCKGELAKNWFQVSPMGATTLEDIQAWCDFIRIQA
jgi:2-aminoethylphosphonate-pyruvate transaminase